MLLYLAPRAGVTPAIFGQLLPRATSRMLLILFFYTVFWLAYAREITEAESTAPPLLMQSVPMCSTVSVITYLCCCLDV